MIIKSVIKSIPGAIPLYYRLMRPRAFADMKRRKRSRNAIRAIERIHRATGLPAIKCDTEGVWVMDERQVEWFYDTYRGVGAMGLECGQGHDPTTTKLLLSQLKPGHVFIDVGANVGHFSLAVAKMIDGVRVYAFEPVGTTFDLLGRNIARNRLSDRVVAHRLALGERRGKVYVTNNMNTGNHLIDGENGKCEAVEEVRQECLDGLLDQMDCRHVDFIKCDIEGAEMEFLRGAANTLRTSRPQVILEVADKLLARMGSSAEEVFGFLREMGYVCAPLFPDGTPSGPVADPTRYLGITAQYYFT